MMKASGVAPREGAKLWAGRYELGERLGAGGLATVYRGRLIAPGGFARPVAIKRLHPHWGRHADAAMFLDEARIASSIVHPNVVATLDVVAEADEYVVVMELVLGPTLERLLARGAPPLPVTLRIVTDALRGLHAAHVATDAAGEPLHVVHRDVAPSNVLVGYDGVARISDFGVAKARGRLASTQNGEVKGHLSYMAPEQLVGDGIDARADTFGAGVILWEALTGRRLFHGETEAQIVYTLLERPIAPPRTIAPGIPEAVEAVVQRALEREPAARFPSARAMADALEASSPLATAREVAAWVATREPDAADDSPASGPATAADTWLDPPPVTARSRRTLWRVLFAVAVMAAVAATIGARRAAATRATEAVQAMRTNVPATAPTEGASAADLPVASLVTPGGASSGGPAEALGRAAPAPSAPAEAHARTAPRTPPSPPAAHRVPRRATPVRLYARD
jgi:hypothetical protein